jgi:hypothetical protein
MDYKEKLRKNTIPNEKISALCVGIENNIFFLLFSIWRFVGLINYTKKAACSDVTPSDLCARTSPRHLCYNIMKAAGTLFDLQLNDWSSQEVSLIS